MATNATRAMQDAAATAVAQQDIIQAYVLLYGTAETTLANDARDRAHAALDALLDAQRAKHHHLVRVMRGE